MMFTVKRLSSMLIAFIIIFSLVIGIYSSPAYSAPKETKIGFVLSMTGVASVYGETQKNGAQMAIDEINALAGKKGIKIVPLFEDDASMPQQGVNVFKKFIKEDKVAMIIGPTLSNTARVTDIIAQKEGVPVLAISNTIKGLTDIGDFIFRNSLTEAVVIPNTIRIAKEKFQIAKVALLYGKDDAFTKGGYDDFKKALHDAKIKILNEQTFLKGDSDFSKQLEKIKGVNPNAIIVSALAEEASAIIIQARQIGIPATIPIIGGNGFNSPAMIKNAGEAAEGLIVGAAWNTVSENPMNRKFVDSFTAKYKNPPDQFAAQAYAGVYIAYEAIKKSGTTNNRKAIRDTLSKIKDLDTVLGKFSFTKFRDANHKPIVQQVKGGKFFVLGE
ncbi:MAG: ABC transporter substrate-binding protein [Desulfobacterales bacterium]|nr:ABC transporter substrate-binding protein [Desulfobacterales bacterium]